MFNQAGRGFAPEAHTVRTDRSKVPKKECHTARLARPASCVSLGLRPSGKDALSALRTGNCTSPAYGLARTMHIFTHLLRLHG